MNEEIVFGMNLDTTGFARGLRSARQMAAEAGAEIKKSLTEGLKGLVAPVAGLFAADKLIESIRGVAEWGKQIKITGAEAGVSTDFVQGLQAAAYKLGVSTESANTSLATLSRKVGEARTGSAEAAQVFDKWGISIAGLTNEQIFFQIADRMKAIQDPAERSAMAFDLMGKGAKEMVALLPQGAAGLKQFFDSASKLTEDQIDQLHDLDAKLEETGRRWHVIWGSILTAGMDRPHAGISEEAIRAKENQLMEAAAKGGFHPTSFGMPGYGSSGNDYRQLAIDKLIEEGQKTGAVDQADQSRKNQKLSTAKEIARLNAESAKAERDNSLAQMPAEKRLVELQDQKKNAVLDWIDAIDEGDKLFQAQSRNKIDSLDKELTAARKLVDEEKKRTEATKEHAAAMQFEIARASERAGKSAEALAERKGDRSKLTVDELFNSRLRFGGQLGVDQQLANRIKWDEQRGENLRQRGFLDESTAQFTEADKLRAQLSGNVVDKDRFPFKSLEESAKESNDALQELLSKAKNEGINIVPKMGA